MKNILRISIILIYATSTACAQNIYNEMLSGTWKHVGNNQEGIIECPDVLLLQGSNNTYIILNDCYGNDITSPIVETGKWYLDKAQTKITLLERTFTTNYSFKNKSSTLVGYIRTISSDEINICFGNQGNCIDEKYVRNRKIK